MIMPSIARQASRLNVGPPSATVAQQKDNTEPIHRVRRDVTALCLLPLAVLVEMFLR